MKTTLSLLLSLLLVSSCRGEDYLKDKITPNFTLLKRNQVGLMSKQAGPTLLKNPEKLLVLLCPQEFEKREYEPTTWLRTSVESADSAGISKAHGHLKSFVENAQNNIEAEGLLVPETCYCAVRLGHKHHPEERKKPTEKTYCTMREIKSMFSRM